MAFLYERIDSKTPHPDNNPTEVADNLVSSRNIYLPLKKTIGDFLIAQSLFPIGYPRIVSLIATALTNVS